MPKDKKLKIAKIRKTKISTMATNNNTKSSQKDQENCKIKTNGNTKTTETAEDKKWECDVTRNIKERL